MHNDFYILVAQVLPILFLAVSIQSGFFLKDINYLKNEYFQRNVHIMILFTIILILSLGEFSALRAVYTGESYPNDLVIVIISLVLPTILVSLDSVLNLLNKSKEFYYLAFAVISIASAILIPFLQF